MRKFLFFAFAAALIGVTTVALASAQRNVSEHEAQLRLLPGLDAVVEAFAFDADIHFLAWEHPPFGAAAGNRQARGIH